MSMQKLGTTLPRSRALTRVVTGFLFIVLAGMFLDQIVGAQGTPAQTGTQPSAQTAPSGNSTSQPGEERLPPEALGPSTNPPPPPPVVATPPPAQNAGPKQGAPGTKAPQGPSANAEGI